MCYWDIVDLVDVLWLLVFEWYFPLICLTLWFQCLDKEPTNLILIEYDEFHTWAISYLSLPLKFKYFCIVLWKVLRSFQEYLPLAKFKTLQFWYLLRNCLGVQPFTHATLQLISGQHIQAHFPYLFSISKSWLISSYSLSSSWSYCLGSCLLLHEFLKLLFRGF